MKAFVLVLLSMILYDTSFGPKDYTVLAMSPDLQAASLFVYDMAGRLVTEEAIIGGAGELILDTQAWPLCVFQVELWPDAHPEQVFYGGQLIKL